MSDIPGTTRDAIDTRLPWGRTEIVLIDTAGIRRRGASPVGRTRSASRRCAPSVPSRAPTSRCSSSTPSTGSPRRTCTSPASSSTRAGDWSSRSTSGTRSRRRPTRTFDQYVEWIRHEAPFLDFAPIVSISAKTGQRVARVLELAVDVWAERRRRVPTGELNRIVGDAVARQEPAAGQGPRAEALLRHAGRASRRRRSCSSRARRARSTSATAATSRTGSAMRSGSSARRSGWSSASGDDPRAASGAAGGARQRAAAAEPAQDRRRRPRHGHARPARPRTQMTGSRADGRARRRRRRRQPAPGARRSRSSSRAASRCSCSSHSAETAAQIATTRRNEKRLPGDRAAGEHPRDRRPGRLAGAADLVIFAVPSAHLRATSSGSRRHLAPTPTCCRSSRASRTGRCCG